MSEEKTIYIRCSAETNDLLDKIRKAEMPHRSRNSQIIYLIHQEAKKLDLDNSDKQEEVKLKAAKESSFSTLEKETKRGLRGLAGTKRQANLQ